MYPYICAVCGNIASVMRHTKPESALETGEICPCCGFHYGYDDMNASAEYSKDATPLDIIKIYRSQWIKDGMKWWSINPLRPKPPNWDPLQQLKNIPKEFLGPDEKY